MTRKKENLEFRYYEVPHGEPLLALLGDVWVRPYGYDDMGCSVTDLHFHNLMEIGYCYEGTGIMVLEDEQHEYGPGTITVIPRNYPHTTCSAQKTGNRWEYLFIDEEKLLSSFYPNESRRSEEILGRIRRGPICTTSSESPELSNLIRTILKEMSEQKEMYADVVFGLLRSLFIEISRHHPALIEGAPPISQKPDSILISRSLEYIGDHFSKTLRVEDLAALCHMSETHFRRIFRECMGCTPVEYINQVRVRAVCELLRKSNEPISDIALKCGFTSLATFNRNFRRYIGTTPNEWRKSPDAYERRLFDKNILVRTDGKRNF